MITLVLEAATYHGSVALLRDEELIGEMDVAMRGREHEALMAAVGGVLSAHDVAPSDIARVVCGAGPGSFTSLRIAASIAKGIAMATGALLLPVSSLTLLAASYEPRQGARVLATIDAMRGEMYAQLHERDGESVVALNSPAIVATSELNELAKGLDAVVIGPSAPGDLYAIPRAKAVVHLIGEIRETQPADLAAWEPAYGRLAEAQVKWEATHGRPLTT